MKKILKNTCYVLGVILVSALIAVGGIYLFAKRNVATTGNVLGISWYNETDKEFTLDTVDELYEFAKLSTYYNFKGQTIKLGADIIINEGNAEDWEEKAPSRKWTAINGFAGTFDGQGHTISGLYAKGYNASIALFKNAKRECHIQNFKITNSYLEGRGFGGVASVVSNGGGNLKQIYSDAIITIKGSYSGYAGGICSKVNVATSIEECWYDGVITNSGRNSGGIVDDILGCMVELSHCLFSGEIHSTWDYSGTRTGGLVGRMVNEGAKLTVTDCLSYGTITSAHNSHTGAILGTAMTGTTLICKDTYAARGTYASVGQSGSNGTMESLPLETVADHLVGYKAYQWTNLDFAKYWSVVEEDRPILTCFAENSPSLDGIQKAYDISWYSEASGGVITTKEQLYGFYILSGRTDFANKIVKLGADITLNEGKASTFSKSEQVNIWSPLNGFAGVFDGQRYTISGMYVNSATRYVGFFGMTKQSCAVKNISIKNSIVINHATEATTPISTGSIAGVAHGKFENIYSDANLETTGLYMGGLFGQIYQQTTLSNCWFNGKITHNGRYAGGVLGIVSDSTATVEHCLNTGEIEIIWKNGYCNSGGIVGSTLNSSNVVLTISDCLNVGQIKTTTGGTGSVLGHCVKGYVNIKDSYAVKSSNVKDGKSVGWVQGTVIGGAGALREELLIGYNAFDWSTLDFDKHWSIVLNGTPVLKAFASSSPSVAGRKKAFDMSWYDEKATSYVIKNDKQLYGLYIVSSMTNFKGKTVKLGNNITLNAGDASAWDAENIPTKKWYPLAEFAGTFDGQGHTISGLYFNGAERYVGFFSKTTVDAVVKNLRVENSKFINHLGGKKLLSTGSIAGAGHGTFDTIYSNALIEVSGDGAGGLLGQVYKKTIVKNCQYDGTLTNIGRYSAGIVGCVTGETVDIINCLNTGMINVTKDSGYVQAGGILGGTYYKEDIVVNITDCLNSGSIVTNQGGTGSVLGHCVLGTINIKNTYATTESNTKNGMSVGWVQGTVNGTVRQIPTAMMTGVMGYQSTYLDFDKYWAAVENNTPQLKSFATGALNVAGLAKLYDMSWYDKDKSEYTLTDVNDLYGFTYLSMTDDFTGKTVKLGKTITLNEGDADTFETTPPKQAWIPIGRFAGTFDGQGNSIKGLYIASGSKVGLFSETTKDAVVKNLKLEEAYITGTSNDGSGSVVGRGGGTFSAIYSDAIVTSGNKSIGGIIGYINADTSMEQVKFAGRVTGLQQVGGFVANVKGANVSFTNCHISGTVITTASSGHMNAGMLVGMIDANSDVAATNCLASGYLKPKVYKDSNYSRALVGKVTGNNALFHGKNVVIVNDTDHVHATNKGYIGVYNPKKDDGKASYTNCGWKGTAGSGIKRLSIAQITGLQAKYNFTTIALCDNMADTSKLWVAMENDAPTLRIFADTKQVVDFTQYIEEDTAWYDDAKNGVGESADNPYIIADEGDLLGLSSLVNDGITFLDRYIKLETDIEFNKDAPATLEEWKNYTPKNTFVPIGGSTRFQGHFDGNDCKISGIYIPTANVDYVGLFGATDENAEIHDLTLKNSYIAGKKAVGSIVGQGGGTFTNVHSNAVVVAAEWAGGILGLRNTYVVTMKDCSYSGEVSATGNNIGGMLGIMQGNSKSLTFTNCEFKGNVNTTGSQAGGFIGGVGGNSEVKITGCKSTGTVTADGEKAGGYIGTIAAAATIIIQNSESDATVTAGSLKAGGYIGYNQSATKVTIKNSTSGATVTATGKQAGGFIGMTDKPVELSSVQFAGSATGLQHVGGFVGAANNTTVRVTDGLMSGTVQSTITAAEIVANKDSKQGVSVGGICGIIVNAKADVTATRCLITGTITCAAAGDANCGEHVGRMDKGKYTADNVYVQKGCCASFEDTDTATDTAVGYKADAAAFDIKETCKRLNASELKGEDAKTNASGLFADNNNWATQALGHPTLTLLSWYDPEKTEFYINSKADLFEFAKASQTDNFAGKTVYLSDNIDVNEGTAEEMLARATDTDAANDPIAWTPIGPSTTNLFAGVFDGQGYTISGIYINSSNTNLQGLFAYVGDNDGDCQIKNFTLDKTYIHGKDNTGSIVAAQREKATFENLTSNAVIKGAAKVGGIIGEVQATVDGTTITNCTFNGSITATANNSGGMIGLTSGNATNGNFTITLDNCTFGQNGSITGTQAGGMIGGIGAAQNAVTIHSCRSEGIINATTVGGLIGKVANTQKNTQTGTRMNSCTVSATLTGTTKGKYVGSISSSIASYVFLNNLVLTTEDNTYSSN